MPPQSGGLEFVMKNGSGKKFRFNVIDIILVLVIILAVGGIFIRSGIGEKITVSSRSEEVEIRFLALNLDHAAGDAFIEGDSVYLNSTGKKIGNLASEKTIVPAEKLITLSDGSIIKTESYDARNIDVRGGVLVSGVFNEDGSFMLDGNTCLVPGMTLSFHTDNIIVSTIITEIKHLS